MPRCAGTDDVADAMKGAVTPGGAKRFARAEGASKYPLGTVPYSVTWSTITPSGCCSARCWPGVGRVGIFWRVIFEASACDERTSACCSGSAGSPDASRGFAASVRAGRIVGALGLTGFSDLVPLPSASRSRSAGTGVDKEAGGADRFVGGDTTLGTALRSSDRSPPFGSGAEAAGGRFRGLAAPSPPLLVRRIAGSIARTAAVGLTGLITGLIGEVGDDRRRSSSCLTGDRARPPPFGVPLPCTANASIVRAKLGDGNSTGTCLRPESPGRLSIASPRSNERSSMFAGEGAA